LASYCKVQKKFKRRLDNTVIHLAIACRSVLSDSLRQLILLVHVIFFCNHLVIAVLNRFLTYILALVCVDCFTLFCWQCQSTRARCTL